MFPAFVNNMTIDWFSEWPHDALLEVAEKYLSTMTMASEEEVNTLSVISLICRLDTTKWVLSLIKYKNVY